AADLVGARGFLVAGDEVVVILEADRNVGVEQASGGGHASLIAEGTETPGQVAQAAIDRESPNRRGNSELRIRKFLIASSRRDDEFLIPNHSKFQILNCSDRVVARRSGDDLYFSFSSARAPRSTPSTARLPSWHAYS